MTVFFKFFRDIFTEQIKICKILQIRRGLRYYLYHFYILTNQGKYGIFVSNGTAMRCFMKKQAIFDTVRAVPLFASLSDSDLKSLISSSKLSKYEQGEIITSAGNITVVLKGSVSASKSSGDKKLIMRMFGAGNVSGVASLFSDEHDAVSTLTALNAVEVLIISGETISALIHSNGAFATDYIRFLTSRIRFLNSRIKAYTASGTEAKLALHLLFADETEAGEVELHVSYSRLADMLDIGRASLYRALDSLTAKGVIEKNGKRILIKNKAALQRISDGQSKE